MPPVRTAVIGGLPARVKVCSGCDRRKRVDEDPRLSEFPLNGRRSDGSVRGWKPRCKRCYRDAARIRRRQRVEEINRRKRELYHAKMANPEERAVKRAAERELRRRKRLNDPAFVEAERRRSREWKRKKMREDPDYFSPERKAQRAAARRVEVAPTDGTAPRIPAEPFHDWLRAYMDETGIEEVEAAARELDLVPRRVRSVLGREYERVSIDVVDQALLNSRVIVEVRGRPVVTLEDLLDLGAAA